MASTPKVLPKKDLTKALKGLSQWKTNTKETELSRVFEFPSFITAFTFVAKVAVHAEVANHHPDIELSYGRVKITLTTHDAKGLTKADFELAKRIDTISI